jgi:protein-S-isoprenylcysteine O-methyltransferase Ste14
MELFPELQLNPIGGWLIVVAFFAIYGITLRFFSQEVRQRLYDRKGWSKQQQTLSAVGVPFALAAFILIMFSPLKVGRPIFLVGLSIYLLALFAFLRSLVDFRNTPVGKPVTEGMYKWSRNPQWVSFAILAISMCLMVGSWSAIGLLSVRIVLNHFRILGEENACIKAYGESYREYMCKVPRYAFGL